MIGQGRELAVAFPIGTEKAIRSLRVRGKRGLFEANGADAISLEVEQ